MNEWLGQHKRQLGVISKAGLQYVAHYALQQNSWCVVIMWQTRIREVTARQTRWKPFTFPMTSVLFPPFYVLSLSKQPVQGVKLGRKKHAPFQRGTGHKFTVAHGLECKPLSFMGLNLKKKKIIKNQVDANIGPICLTSCFLWSPTQLYFPQAARTEDSFIATQFQHLAACGIFFLGPPVINDCVLKHVFFKASCTAICPFACSPDHSNVVSVSCSYYVSSGI